MQIGTWAALAAALMTCVWSGAATAAGLTGGDRSDFVNSSIQSCTAKQQSLNSGVSSETIAKFCTCYSNAMADKIEESELPKLTAPGANALQMLQSRIDDAQRSCAP